MSEAERAELRFKLRMSGFRVQILISKLYAIKGDSSVSYLQYKRY